MIVDIQYLLKNLCDSFHPSTLCVTHDFEEAFFLGDRTTIFIDGYVEQVGKQMVYFQTTEGKILFEIAIPNFAFRNLHLSNRKMVKIALQEEFLWLMN
jgi:ABC-type proline/glycine betaine transport system ATPase subunit